MVLTVGQRLGQYEILGALGAGGMGEVYRARDTRLKRDVALKILPEHYGQDADRLARFQREAEALASLSHPNIAAIYGRIAIMGKDNADAHTPRCLRRHPLRRARQGATCRLILHHHMHHNDSLYDAR